MLCNETFHGAVLQTRQNNKIQTRLKRVNGREGRVITSLIERERERERDHGKQNIYWAWPQIIVLIKGNLRKHLGL